MQLNDTGNYISSRKFSRKKKHHSMFFWCLQPSHVAGRNCTVSSGETGTSLPSAVGSLGKDGFNGLGRGGIRRSQALREGIRPRGGIPAKQQQSSAEE